MNNKDLKELIIAIAKGLESTNNELVEEVLINNIRNAFQISNEVIVKEVEKIVEVEKEVPVEVPFEVIKEVIPEEVEEELDSLKKSLKEKEEELNDTMNILETTLDEKDQLEARCTELHEQNEYLLSKLEEPEEVTFEEPEEVSNEDILANSMNEEVSNEDILANSMNEEVDEEAILNQLEKSLEKVAIEEPEKKVNSVSHTSKRKANSTYDMYGNPRKQRFLRQNDDDTKTFLDYYNQIKSGKLDETNVNEESIQEIYDLAIKINNGLVPTEVLNLYNTIIGDEN